MRPLVSKFWLRRLGESANEVWAGTEVATVGAPVRTARSWKTPYRHFLTKSWKRKTQSKQRHKVKINKIKRKRCNQLHLFLFFLLSVFLSSTQPNHLHLLFYSLPLIPSQYHSSLLHTVMGLLLPTFDLNHSIHWCFHSSRSELLQGNHKPRWLPHSVGDTVPTMQMIWYLLLLLHKNCIFLFFCASMSEGSVFAWGEGYLWILLTHVWLHLDTFSSLLCSVNVVQFCPRPLAVLRSVIGDHSFMDV